MNRRKPLSNNYAYDVETSPLDDDNHAPSFPIHSNRPSISLDKDEDWPWRRIAVLVGIGFLLLVVLGTLDYVDRSDERLSAHLEERAEMRRLHEENIRQQQAERQRQLEQRRREKENPAAHYQQENGEDGRGSESGESSENVEDVALPEPVEVPEMRLEAAQHIKIGNVDAYFRAPSQPKALMVAFHGCTHDGEDWFKLPEERRIVDHLLRNDVMVVAPSSRDRFHECWSLLPHDQNPDLKDIVPFIEEFRSAHSLNELPLYAIGASSGGSFLSTLFVHFHLDGAIVQISPGSHEFRKADLSTINVLPRRVAILYMTGDTEFAAKVSADSMRERLRKSGVETRVFAVPPLPLTPTLLHDRVAGVSLEMSRAFYEQAQRDGYIDKSGHLTRSPRESHAALNTLSALHRRAQREPHAPLGVLQWGRIVEQSIQQGDGAQHEEFLLGLAVAEELNAAEGVHELTSEQFERVYAFVTAPRSAENAL